MSDRYLDRATRLSQAISDQDWIKAKIVLAFRAAYGKNGLADEIVPEWLASEGLTHLGSGESHCVIGLNEMLIDTAEGHSVHLAIRLLKNRDDPYLYDPSVSEPDSDLLEGDALVGEISRFSEAFSGNIKTPYFVSVATASEYYREIAGQRLRFAGILMEDLTEGGTCTLREDSDRIHFTRTRPDGTRERFFLDPSFGRIRNYRVEYIDSARVVNV